MQPVWMMIKIIFLFPIFAGFKIHEQEDNFETKSTLEVLTKTRTEWSYRT